ncbi:MAG: undecaprenyl-diphosphate phosphatase [Burkholderiaceae bacterium]|jgi:undecaprenyl-diphosphatase|nr:undecaprenyl-diphosphate phosphatase [Oxalobacteraceae bacterium]
MEISLAIKVIIMGIVEGLTEFLPISSTGHLILAGSLLNFTGEKVKVFEIVIQAGAMLAVCWEYRVKIARVILDFRHDITARRFVVNLLIAFLPAVILGLAFGKAIKAHLFKPVPVALAFIVGAFIIIIIERRHRRVVYSRVDSVDDMSALDALKVGLAQCFALIPGTSRSGATIIGAMAFGLSRQAATEFSFFLAIPTLFGATVYSLYKERALLSVADLPMFGLGALSAFISAFLCVRWLLRYISSHDFMVFAWYRIIFGVLILVTAWTGWVQWTE